MQVLTEKKNGGRGFLNRKLHAVYSDCFVQSTCSEKRDDRIQPGIDQKQKGVKGFLNSETRYRWQKEKVRLGFT